MNSEHDVQAALIRWARDAAEVTNFKELAWLHAIPNGAAVSNSQRIRLWQEGVTRGIADLFLPVARQRYHGFYIEMKKSPSEKLRIEQEKFAAFCDKQGYLYQRHDNCKSAIEALEWYLEMV